ncbi:MAG: hypothetical protein V5B38_02395 [Candidatus Accumulibacter propinquus]
MRLYLQNGNLAVALEELTMAIVIDPDYAKAYARADWRVSMCARCNSPTRTFSAP